MTATAPAPTALALPTDRRGVTFPRVVRAEAIKLFSLRSTIWCLALVVVITVGLGILLSWGIVSNTPEGQVPAGLGIQVAVFGTAFTQLVSVVLGALVVTGEYSTGMIRSTLTAVPTRLPVLAAKALVFAVTIFAVTLVSMLITVAATTPMVPEGSAVDLASGESWRALLGGAGYIAAIGLISLGIGTLIRNGAGAIASGLGLVLVVPTILSVIPVEWIQDLVKYLPSNAGNAMYLGGSQIGPGALEPWQGLLVLLAWLAVTLIPAAVLLKRRDA